MLPGAGRRQHGVQLGDGGGASRRQDLEHTLLECLAIEFVLCWRLAQELAYLVAKRRKAVSELTAGQTIIRW